MGHPAIVDETKFPFSRKSRTLKEENWPTAPSIFKEICLLCNDMTDKATIARLKIIWVSVPSAMNK